MFPGFAHGIGEVYTIPVPLGYYLFASALAVAVSFFLFAIFVNKPGLKQVSESRIETPWLPKVIVVLKFLSLTLLLLIITTGLLGSQEPLLNFGPYYFWTIFVVGFLVVNVLVGNAWKFISPFKTLSEMIVLKTSSKKLLGSFPWWLPSLLLLSLYWWELVSDLSYIPTYVGGVLLFYSLINIYLATRCKDWLERGEVFGTLFTTIGKLAYVRIGDDAKSLIVTKPAQQISTRTASKGTLLFVTILLAGASFDSFKETVFWFDILRSVDFSGPLFTNIAETITLLLFPLPFLGAFLLAIKLMQKITRSSIGWRQLAGRFAWSLLPIAFGYTLAHNFALVLTSLPILISLLSDPFGLGWNLFGTAVNDGRPLLLGARAVWFIQIGLVVLAHIVGVWFAHVIAQRVFKTRSDITRSQYPMVALMLAYTILTLYLLSLAIVV